MKKSKLALVLSLALLLQGGLWFTPEPRTAAADPTDLVTAFVTRQGDKLMEGDEEFRFVSANAPTLTFVEDIYWHLPDPWEQRDALTALRQMGATATRTYTLSVRKASDYDGQIRHVEGPGQFNEQAFVALDKAIQLAHETGVRLIIPFVDQYEWWGGITSYAALRGKSQDAFWSDPQLIADFKATISYVLNRTNTFTGVAYKDDPAILAWETGNELVPKADGWTDDIAAYIKSIDANHLVIDGRYGIDDRSLNEASPVDIVSNHYYPNHYGDFTLQANLDRAKSKNKKPLIIGEFGFIPADKVDSLLDAVVDNGTAGAMLWSLRYRNKDGGFYPHTESTQNGIFYGSYRWPGFPSGDGFQETATLQTLSNHAYRIRGLSNPGLPVPEAPELLPIDSVSAISWRGATGAQSYRVERAESEAGPWTTVASAVYDAVTMNEQLFDDTTSVTGATYYYRVQAHNGTGDSAWAASGPVVARHMIIDPLANDAHLFEYSPDVKWDPDNEAAYGGDGTRLKALEPEQYVGYALPSAVGGGAVSPVSFTVETYFDQGQEDSDFVLSASEDGETYAPLSADRTTAATGGHVKTVYRVTTALPAAAKYFRIAFPDPATGARLGDVRLEYAHASGSALVYPEPRTKALVGNGFITDEFNDFRKMDSHTPNLSFLNDQPEFFGNDAKRLIQTANTPESFIYQAGGDMNSFRFLAFLKQDPGAYIVDDFKFYTSADGASFTAFAPSDKSVVNGEGWWAKTEYTAYSLPAGTRYLKVEFPKLPDGHGGDAWNPQASRMQIGVGSEKLEPPAQTGKSSVIEDFESYSGSDSALRGAYAVNSSGAPIQLSLDGDHKAQGNFGLRMEAGFTTATGWGGIEKPLANGDWSGHTGIRFWVDPNRLADEGISIQFNEGAATNGEVWKADVRVSGDEPRWIELPFSRFAVVDWWENSHPDAGNHVIDLADIDIFSVYVDAAEGSKTLYLDSFTLYKSPVIDDFESYDGDDAKLQAAYARNDSGDEIAPSLDSGVKSQGGYGMKLDYALTDAKGYAGLTRSLGGADWTGSNGVRLWLQSDDVGRGLTVQFKEGSGEYWEAKLSVDTADGRVAELPYQVFRMPGWSMPVNGRPDLNDIQELSIYVDKGSVGAGAGTMHLDAIEAAPFALIDNFEYYEGNSGKLNAGFTANAGGDSILLALDGGSKQDGKFSLKLDYALTDGKGYAGVTESLFGANWSASGNAIEYWVKADGSNHDLMLQLAETDGDLWEAHTALTDSGERMVRIPFASFSRNGEWSTGDGSLTLGSMKDWSIYVNKGSGEADSRTIYLDGFRIATVPELDDFEHYNGAELVEGRIYTANPYGGSVRMTPDSGHVHSGRYGIRYEYELPAADKNFAGVTKLLPHMNWIGYEGVEFWIVPDGSNHKLVFQFKEPDGETWESYLILSDTQPKRVRYPLDGFAHAPWNAAGNGTLDLGDITEFSIYVNQENGELGTGTLYLDGIRLYQDDGEDDNGDDGDHGGDDSGNGGGDNGGGLTQPGQTATITDNGVSIGANGTKVTKPGGANAASIVTVDPAAWTKALELLDDAEGKPAQLIIPALGAGSNVQLDLTGEALTEAMHAHPDIVVLVQTEAAAYYLPMGALNLDDAAARLGVDASQLQLHLQIERLADDALTERGAVQPEGAEPVSGMVRFGLSVEANGQTLDLNDFGSTFVSRTMTVDGEWNADELSAMAYDPATNGYVFVPATMTAQDGRTNVTIKRNSNSIYTVVKHQASFADVPDAYWAQSSIDLLASKFVLQGRPSDRFDPEAAVTRAEFAAMLARGFGLSGHASAALAFRDVPEGVWYAGAAGAANEYGWVTGYPDGTFRGDEPITRAEMAVMTARALEWLGRSDDGDGRQALVFTDGAVIPSWAKQAVDTASRLRILNGLPAGRFAPNEHATRAQAAVVLAGLLRHLHFID